MNFRRKTIPRIQSLGERIKRTRHQKKISLIKMEGLTKIRSRHIDALEKGKYENLPGDIYIRGFLRKIARVLHMDETKLISLYETETKGKDKKMPLDVMREISFARFVITPKMIIGFFSLLLVAAIGGYLWYQVSGFAAAPNLTISEPIKEDLVVTKDRLEVTGQTDPGTNITINDQAIAIDPDGHFSENIMLKSGLNQIDIVARNKIGKEVSKLIKVLAKIPSSLTKTGRIAGEKVKEPLFLIVKIGPSSAWLSIDVDGKNIYQGLMLTNTSQEFVAEKEISVTSTNAGSTRVYLNGKDLGILGEEGKGVQNIKYDLTALVK